MPLKLRRIRATLAGAVRDADGVAAVRSALFRLFVSRQAVEGYDEKLRPVLAKKP